MQTTMAATINQLFKPRPANIWDEDYVGRNIKSAYLFS